LPSLPQGVQAAEQVSEALPEVPGITGVDGSIKENVYENRNKN
jgi:hypothetical protein